MLEKINWAPQELQAHSDCSQLSWRDWKMNILAVAAHKLESRGERTTLLTTQTKNQLLHSHSYTEQQLNFTSQL